MPTGQPNCTLARSRPKTRRSSRAITSSVASGSSRTFSRNAIDGTNGSAVAGLRNCTIQPYGATPRPVWNPDIDSPIKHYDHWLEVPDSTSYDNAFKIQWELFLRHVAGEGAFRWNLLEGAKGVQLAELGLRSWQKRCWQDVKALVP